VRLRHAMPVRIARSSADRRRGLLGASEPPAQGTGLLIDPCGAIHMVGMQFPIDLVFLARADPGDDALLRVCFNGIHENVPSGWSFRAANRMQYFFASKRILALEMRAGSLRSPGCIISPWSVLRLTPDEASGPLAGFLANEALARAF